MSVEVRVLINPYNDVRVIDVFGPLKTFGGLIHIGTLTQVSLCKYVFEYSLNPHAMVTRPLRGMSAMVNETDDVMKWGFFKSRIPPLKRPDVKRLIEETGLDATKPMALLAALGAREIITSRILVARF